MSDLDFNQKLDESFKNLTAFFEEIAVILRDCDRLMGDEGYSPSTGSTVVYDMSRSIYKSDGWIPSYLARAYVPEENSEDNSFTHIKFVSIFLRYESGGTKDVEMDDNIPLVVAGIIIPKDLENFKFVSWQTKAWFWADNEEYEKYESDEYDRWINEDAEADGTITVFYPAKNNKWFRNVEILRTFAYPLEDITNSTTLKEKIIDGLCNIDESV
jgi:hypothetical protein